MTSVKEFIEVRKSIETLANEITMFVEHGAIQDSRQHLDKANQQLGILKTMVANDVQVLSARRLSGQLTYLGAKVESMTTKISVKKIAAKKKHREAI